jgi:uncharacterized protein GlcG (DUF336 family)
MATYTKESIGAEDALKALDAGRAKAAELSVPVSLVVLDESGHQKAALRMDGAASGAAEVGHDKAYTVIFLGLPLRTEQLFEALKDNPAAVSGIAGRERITLLGGGAPIMSGDRIIGAIGVSGGRESDDIEVMEAALAAIV